MRKNIQAREKNTLDELKFRLDFRDEYGIDYNEAIDNLKRKKEESAARWNQILLKYNLI